MEANQHIWRYWAQCTQRWGGAAAISILLETFGAFGAALAQLVYICQPVAQWVVPHNHLEALASLLENPQDQEEFIGYLRGAGGR